MNFTAHLIYARANTYHSKFHPNQITIHSRNPNSVLGILLDHKYRLPLNIALPHDGAEQDHSYEIRPLDFFSAEPHAQIYHHNVMSLVHTILFHFHHVINNSGPRSLYNHVEYEQKEVMEVGRYHEVKDPLTFAPNLYHHDLDLTQTFIWAIISNGRFLEKSILYLRMQEAKGLFNCLTFNKVGSSYQMEGNEDVEAANIPLPPDSEHDFPNARVPLTQHLTHLGCLSDFRMAFIAAMRGEEVVNYIESV